MQQNMDPIAVADAVWGMELARALDHIERMEDSSSYLEVEVALEEKLRENSDGVAAYCLGIIKYNVGKDNDAIKYLKSAGEAGFSSGFYKAAMIMEMGNLGTRESHVDGEVLALLKNAARSGHIFAELSARRRSVSGISDIIGYVIYRFLIAPFKILMIGMTSPDSDRLRV